MARRQKEFNDSYKHWIALQNDHFAKNGLWCDGLVPWIERCDFVQKTVCSLTHRASEVSAAMDAVISDF